MEHIHSYQEWEGDHDYVKCGNCGSLYRAFRPKHQVCTFCSSKDIGFVSREEYEAVKKSKD